jgi:hypothetical protein
MTKYLKAVLLGVVMLIASFAGAQVVTSAQGFTVTAPITLTANTPTTGTTNSGLAFTLTSYTGELPNKDVYMVCVAVYATASLDQKSLQGAIDNIALTANATIIDSRDTVVSGQPAKLVAFKLTSGYRVAYLVTLRGNILYQFMFITDPTVTSDMDAVHTFFNSATI